MKLGQASVETIFVISLSTFMLIPASYMFYQFLVTSSDEIMSNQIDTIGRSFVENANLMYNYGNYARITIDYSFPDNIRNMSVSGNILVFSVGTKDGVKDHNFVFNINVTGSFVEEDWIAGDKTFLFETIRGGDSVLITKI